MTTIENLTQLNIFLVGGAVRDQLLNRPIIERDWLVVGSDIDTMLSLGFTQVGKDFPVFLHPKTKEEYALARMERKSGAGYTGFVCHASADVTIEQDLMRRDLTVNAIAQDNNGNLVDPYNGVDDLNNRLLRHVSPAFAEDPLRVLRVARFAARYAYLGFTVADETMALMREIADSGELSALSAERIWKEVSRALTEKTPEVFIEVLRECGALAQLWPSLNKLWGVPNPAKHHPEICSGVHTLMVLQQACKLSDDVGVRFAALCHDLGKGLTHESKYPSHHGHEKSGLPLVKQICEKFSVPKQIKRLSLLVCEYHLHCHRAFELKATTLMKVFNAADIWRQPEMFQQFLLCCEADARGRTGFEDIDFPQANYLTQAAQAAKSVNVQALVNQGFKGLEMKHALYEARVEAIESFKKSFPYIE